MRVLSFVLAAVAIVVLLFLYVFPWFDRTFVTDPVVPAEASTPFQPEPLGDSEGY